MGLSFCCTEWKTGADGPAKVQTPPSQGEEMKHLQIRCSG